MHFELSILVFCHHSSYTLSTCCGLSRFTPFPCDKLKLNLRLRSDAAVAIPARLSARSSQNNAIQNDSVSKRVVKKKAFELNYEQTFVGADGGTQNLLNLTCDNRNFGVCLMAHASLTAIAAGLDWREFHHMMRSV